MRYQMAETIQCTSTTRFARRQFDAMRDSCQQHIEEIHRRATVAAIACCTGITDGVVMPSSPGGLCRSCSSRALEGRRYCADHATTADDATTASRHWQEQ